MVRRDVPAAWWEGWKAQEQDRVSKRKVDPMVCQCCGNVRKHELDPECICDGLRWFLDKSGEVECEAHRFARAVGGGKKSFMGVGIPKLWRNR